jgi:hypothetical protein
MQALFIKTFLAPEKPFLYMQGTRMGFSYPTPPQIKVTALLKLIPYSSEQTPAMHFTSLQVSLDRLVMLHRADAHKEQSPG